MQKYQNPNFLFDPLWSTLVPQGDLSLKNIETMFLEVNLGGIYCMQKCKIPKFVFYLHWIHPFGGYPSTSGRPRIKKLQWSKSWPISPLGRLRSKRWIR